MSCNTESPSKLKKCNCGLPLARLTSWTRENPGRKFKACKFWDPNTETRGCKCFEWVDLEQTEWQREVINNLTLDKKLMKSEMNSLQREVDDLVGQRRCLLNEVDTLKTKCKALSGDRKKMTGNNGSGDRLQLTVVVVFCVLVMVLGVCVVIKLV
ncbi:uncharacterized protein LOC110683713 [Chenopodium quinoa]|uniref:uncharacterized protein LOC110683713 n=1 Tax=Chenopodium quinoa TaxID=63459 RepID=UPI000B7715F0|nr:uncharacterized protein LOC110683713 [Chenopodium quinoa]